MDADHLVSGCRAVRQDKGVIYSRCDSYQGRFSKPLITSADHHWVTYDGKHIQLGSRP